jgi:hypothetical protein
VVWSIVDPGVLTLTFARLVAFLFVNIIMLGAVVTAGFFGGKLVLKEGQ